MTSKSKAKRRCIFWQTKNYNDERILKHVCEVNLHTQMSIIINLLN
jgi:hypothetical protein